MGEKSKLPKSLPVRRMIETQNAQIGVTPVKWTVKNGRVSTNGLGVKITWAAIAQRRVEPIPIVENHDKFKYGLPCFLPIGKDV